MSMDTVIHAGLSRYARPSAGLVLMGGGARTAYQVGVLQAIAAMIRLQPSISNGFPFQVLVGTSAGALNAAHLASWAQQGLEAFDLLAKLWAGLHSQDVYRLNVSGWVRFSRIAAAWQLTRNARAQGAILDNTPMVSTLHRGLSLQGIEDALRGQAINALAVTASSYSSGTHWTFCQTDKGAPFENWARPGRRSEFTPITVEHLLASSAIPFLFPSTPIWVDGRREYFGDGSMRQSSPLSAAMHLGARKILAIGVGQPERSGLGAATSDLGKGVQTGGTGMTLGSIMGHTMASVFHDTLHADVEQTRRVTATIQQLPREAAMALPYKAVEVMAISPSQSLDAIAQSHISELPPATRAALSGLGMLNGGGGVLASYLLFEPAFVQKLRALGESDAFAKKAELMAFFA
jgi:NTE family protein